VQILVVVANIQVKTSLKAEEEKGSMSTANGHGWVGPKRRGKLVLAHKGGRTSGFPLGKKGGEERGDKTPPKPYRKGSWSIFQHQTVARSKKILFYVVSLFFFFTPCFSSLLEERRREGGRRRRGGCVERGEQEVVTQNEPL
jgi:hypothetical protein